MVPVALAVAEEVGASGRQVLEAVIVGYELQTRLAANNAVYRVVGDRGLRGTTVTGCFAAAATAAKLYGLPAARIAHALGFAASLCASGIEQPILEGTDERVLQLAQNTRGGVESAQLARDGYAGSRWALDGECGFYQAYLGVPMPAEVLAELGTSWRSTMDNLFFKWYPTAGQNVGVVWAAEQLVAEGAITAANVGDIESVSVLQKWWRTNTAYISAGPFTTFEQAILSEPLQVAMILHYGSYTLDNLTRAMTDPDVLALARKVRMDGVATWTVLQGDLSVRLAGGTVVRRSADDLPRWMHAPDWDQVVEKFSRSFGDLADDATRDAIVDFVSALADRSDLAELAKLLRIERPA